MGKKSTKRSSTGNPARVGEKRRAKAQRENSKRRKKLLITAGIAVVLVAAGSVALFAYNQRASRVQDLSEIGQGVPAVVHIHDTTCPICGELRSEVRSIEREFDDSELLLRVADIGTEEGAAFATRYGAQRVTLLFFDGEGELVTRTTGVRDAGALRDYFTRHIAGEL